MQIKIVIQSVFHRHSRSLVRFAASLAVLSIVNSAVLAQRLLPDGQTAQLATINIDGTDLQIVHETHHHIEAPNWSKDGVWLVFNGSGRLWRHKADGSGQPEHIATGDVGGINNDHLLSSDGATIYFSARGHLYSVPLAGGIPRRVSNEHPPEKPLRYYLHGISPDGRTLVYTGAQAEGADQWAHVDIYSIAASGGPDRNLTNLPAYDDGPEYSPDGQWIYFNSEMNAKVPGHSQIYRMRPDGTAIEQITHDSRVNWFPHFSPDGMWIVYLSFPPGTEGHPRDKQVILRRMKPDGSQRSDIIEFNGGQGTINVPSWSPDSKRFAFVMYPKQ